MTTADTVSAAAELLPAAHHLHRADRLRRTAADLPRSAWHRRRKLTDLACRAEYAADRVIGRVLG